MEYEIKKLEKVEEKEEWCTICRVSSREWTFKIFEYLREHEDGRFAVFLFGNRII